MSPALALTFGLLGLAAFAFTLVELAWEWRATGRFRCSSPQPNNGRERP